MVAAGALLVLDHPWWPLIALLAGGIHLDAAGREAAKILSLRQGGIRVGTPANRLAQNVFFLAMAFIAVWMIVYALVAVASAPGT